MKNKSKSPLNKYICKHRLRVKCWVEILSPNGVDDHWLSINQIYYVCGIYTQNNKGLVSMSFTNCNTPMYSMNVPWLGILKRHFKVVIPSKQEIKNRMSK